MDGTVYLSYQSRDTDGSSAGMLDDHRSYKIWQK